MFKVRVEKRAFLVSTFRAEPICFVVVVVVVVLFCFAFFFGLDKAGKEGLLVVYIFHVVELGDKF